MSDPRFSIIPSRALDLPNLTRNDLRVLVKFGKHADKNGWWRLSQNEMARQLEIGRSTVFDCVNRLIEAELLEKHEVDTRSGRDSAHFYRVIYDQGAPESGVPEEVQKTRAGRRERAKTAGETPPENDPAPPAGNPAPPAGSGAAPPAGSGAAPPAGSGAAPNITKQLNEESNVLHCTSAREPEFSKDELAQLENQLREAANLENDPSPDLIVLAEPLSWLAVGCDFELDILPVLRARRKSGIRSWAYFRNAVFEARTVRLHPPPAVTQGRSASVAARGDKFHPPKNKSGRHNMIEAFANIAAKRQGGGNA